MKLIPPPVKPGDTIGITAPAGRLNETHDFSSSCAIIEDMGYRLKYPATGWPGDGFLANRDEARLDEFHRVWSDPEIKAIFALRGGYGCLRIIDRIDFSVIAANPKLFFGFSDITILLNHIFLRTGLVCMHGPVFSSLASSSVRALDAVQRSLTGNWHDNHREDLSVFRAGNNVKGQLVGGNLCSLVTMIGTGYEPDFSGKILFLEDINEPPYRLDRMITQLTMSGKLKNIKGIILGDFSGIGNANEERSNSLTHFVASRICELIPDDSVPVWFGFPAGHTDNNIVVPIGADAEMNGAVKKLIFTPSRYDN